MKNNPYIGPWPFERDDRANFYGRKSEARVLGALIRSEREVLFYATSGAGKTSLLNAAVIPELEEDGFVVLPVARLGSQVPPGIDPATVDNVFAYSILLSLVQEDDEAPALRSCRLRTFLEERIAGLDSQDDRPVLLIVDQLEELFTTHRDRWQDATGFFQQMREALDALPDLGVLLVVREDHLAGVDPYAPLLPRRLQARFRMERLGAEGALAAVSGPADKAGCPFEPDAAKRLVDDLCRIKLQGPGGDGDKVVLGPYVEPVQLQVVCRQLWESLPEGKDGPIHWGEVEQYGGVDRALTGFYQRSLDHVMAQVEPPLAPGWTVTESQLRRWFGEQLITPQGTRGLAFRDERAQETAGLPNAAAELLEDQHIIRALVRAGARWYELAHDRLIEPVQADNAAWRQAHLSPLQHQAALWDERNRRARFLLWGRALEEAEEWASTHEEDLTEVEREFLAASQVSWQGEQERARKRRRRVLALLILGAAFVLVIIGLSLLQSCNLNRKVSSLEAMLTAITIQPCLTCPPHDTTAVESPPDVTPPTSIPTGTPTCTPSPTRTPTSTATPTHTPTPTSTPTHTPTPTSTPTDTPTPTWTPTDTPTPTWTPTHTPTPTWTPTHTPTPYTPVPPPSPPPPPLPAISIGDATASESADSMSFTITLSGPSGQDVSVRYATVDGTATGGEDYIPSSSWLTLPAGQIRGYIEVTLVDDAVYEGDEFFTVVLSNPQNATVGDGQGRGTIRDDQPSISIDDATATELEGTMTLAVNLSTPSGMDVRVAYATADGTATAGTDYASITGTLTIPAGNTSGQIVVEIYPDGVVEVAETFSVTLSGAENATLKDAQGVGTILDGTTILELDILSSRHAIFDHNKPEMGPNVFVVQADVTNTGSFPAEMVRLELDYNKNSDWRLLKGEDPVRIRRWLGKDKTFHAYWFATYPNPDPPETYTYTVTAGAVNAAPFSTDTPVQTVGAQNTGSSKLYGPLSEISVGTFLTTSVSWKLASNFNQALFSPVGNVDFDPASLRLVSATVTLTSNAGVTATYADCLYINPVSIEAKEGRAKFVFLALRPAKGVPLRPYPSLYSQGGFKYPSKYTETVTVITSTMALTMTKDVNASIVQPGESLTYTISYNNTGPVPLQHIWIWDNVDPGIGSITSAFPTPTVLSAHQVAWYVRSVAPEPEGRGVFVLTIDVDGGGQVLTDGQQIVNHAFLGVDPGDIPANPALTSTITSTVHVPAVLVTKTEASETSSLVSMRFWFLGLAVLSLWGAFRLARRVGERALPGHPAPGSGGPCSGGGPDE